jgi:nucleotide-binding universal stress UspA family protein
MTTTVFRRLVVATDFSDSSEAAWQLAQRVAAALGSELVLVHVFVPPLVYGEPAAGAGGADVYEKAERWVEETLSTWAGSARAQGVSVRTVVRTGAAHEEIVALATEERADVLVMGTHGRAGLARVLIGSVAERVLRFAPCPVLTVRTPE